MAPLRCLLLIISGVLINYGVKLSPASAQRGEFVPLFRSAGPGVFTDTIINRHTHREQPGKRSADTGAGLFSHTDRSRAGKPELNTVLLCN